MANAPILLIHGRGDTVEAIQHSRLTAQVLRAAGRPVEFVELEGEDHGPARADTRRQMMSETLCFLKQPNPAR